jgi:hypothetical protein
MTDQGERFVVVVSDHAPTSPVPTSPVPTSPAPTSPVAPAGTNGHGVSQGAPASTASVVQGAADAGIAAGFGLAVISGLADDVRVSSTSSGVSVRMSWPSAAPTA